MPAFTDSIEIGRPPEAVWGLIGTPERWFAGYVETRSRSPGYPGASTRNDHVYRTRAREDVRVIVLQSDRPHALEEHQEGRTFSRDITYTLTPAASGTAVRVEDEVTFKGLGRLAAPLASRDIRKRWATSLAQLKALAETGR